ncbi:leucine-rich PPR motif-containing protein, mitochondrial [Cydia strobilella]|uniref:leucine-rich PPR motif-containing protein, mitochondrial n=1 Tax=Cydia strobilella TaxID=1100964 RepID=UPI0030072801
MSSLLRSTKFVRYFTGAARTLILNSAKTAESNLLVNPIALCSTNNVLLRDYATSKKAESLEPLLQKLDSEARRFGRITKKDIDEVFDEIRSKNDITSSQSLLVIRCCGELVPEELPEQRTLLVQKIWSVLTERGIPMDISHYNALLRVYIENEHPFSPAQFLEELEKKGLQPNRVTYQRLMWRYCQEGDVEGATKVLEKMRVLSMPVSEPVLNALVMGHAFHGDTDGAKAVLETMAGAGLQPTNLTYTLLACGYAKQGDIAGVENVIKSATDKDAYLTDKDILDIIEHLATGGHSDKMESLFQHLQKGMGYNQDVCNVILRLLNKGQLDAAKKIMKTMPKTTNNDDTPFKGAFFIKQLLRVKKSPEDIIKACRELKEEGLVPNSIYIATESALQQGHVELSQSLFKELQKEGHEIRQHYYWPLLAQKGREGDEEGLLQLIRDMVNGGNIPSGEALRDYVIPHLMKKDTPLNIILKLQIANVPVAHAARNLMIELLQAGKLKQAAEVALKYRPRGQYSLITRPLTIALSKTKDINAFSTILHVVCSSQSQVIQTDDDTHDDGQHEIEVGRIVLSALKNLGNVDAAEQLLQAIHGKGLRISSESADAIQQYLGKNLTTELSELLSQLTSPDLEIAPLEVQRGYKNEPRSSAHLEKLLAQGKPDSEKRLQRQLISAYIKENNVEKLNKLLADLKASNFEVSNLVLSQLFEFYCVNDDLEKAKQIHSEILEKDPEFVLNKFKLVQMSYALVRAGKVEEAIQFLKDNRHEPESDKGSFMLNSKCWQMLNSLAEKKEDAIVIEMTKVLLDNNYIEPSNVIFGPSIKVFLLKGDVEAALKQFEGCCKQYRCTPWKGELMKVLITKEDASRLQWLADLSTQIHGEVNVLHDLVLAFVECGRLRQARRILETPGLQARHQRLNDACERYVEEGKSEYLEGLLEATKQLSHIDRSNIFYHLLVTYCKADETDKALGLWTILQEEGEIPSDQFLAYLGKHLKAKNKPVPFIIPEEQGTNKQVKREQQKPKKVQTKPDQSKLSKQDATAKIENLIHDGKITEALDYAVKALDEGTIAKPNILKYLLKKLAEQGEVEKIQELGKRLTEPMKRNVTYDDKLTLAIFTKGAGPQHIDSLYDAVSNAKSDEELAKALVKFPRSNALASVIQDDVFVEKCRKVAELAASRGQHMPANLLWMEYVLAGNDQQADSLWDKCLNSVQSVVFRRLLQESHVRKQPELIEKLIAAMQKNKNITPGSHANAYSRLINLHLLENKVDEAQAVLEKAVKLGVPIDQFNKNSLSKLKEAVEATGQSFKYAV